MVAAERWYEVFPLVYSKAPKDLMTTAALLGAAVLAGGKGAALCGHTAAWWLRLSKTLPALIHVAVRSARDAVHGIRWHRLRLRSGEVFKFSRMPVTRPERAALDVAADLSLWEIKGVLANLEFHHDLEAEAVTPTLRQGYPGAAKLGKAIAEHTPELAATASELEAAFLKLLVEEGFVLPRFNRKAGLSTVDADFEAFAVIARPALPLHADHEPARAGPDRARPRARGNQPYG